MHKTIEINTFIWYCTKDGQNNYEKLSHDKS